VSLILTITGSPSTSSLSTQVAARVGAALAQSAGFQVDYLNIRDLPAEDLVHARFDAPAIRDALARVERAEGVIVATPIYKASYSGVLKAFLDLLPQFGLTNKTVLPLATGGSVANVLAIDYALRPVLSSLNARHVVAGFFILDKSVIREPDGIRLDDDTQQKLDVAVAAFADSVRRHAPGT
jgi:FMN reductase